MKTIIRELESIKESKEILDVNIQLLNLRTQQNGFNSRLDTDEERITDLKDVS